MPVFMPKAPAGGKRCAASPARKTRLFCTTHHVMPKYACYGLLGLIYVPRLSGICTRSLSWSEFDGYQYYRYDGGLTVMYHCFMILEASLQHCTRHSYVLHNTWCCANLQSHDLRTSDIGNGIPAQNLNESKLATMCRQLRSIPARKKGRFCASHCIVRIDICCRLPEPWKRAFDRGSQSHCTLQSQGFNT